MFHLLLDFLETIADLSHIMAHLGGMHACVGIGIGMVLVFGYKLLRSTRYIKIKIKSTTRSSLRLNWKTPQLANVFQRYEVHRIVNTNNSNTTYVKDL